MGAAASLEHVLRLHVALDSLSQGAKLLVHGVIARLPRKGMGELPRDVDDRTHLLVLRIVTPEIDRAWGGQPSWRLPPRHMQRKTRAAER